MSGHTGSTRLSCVGLLHAVILWHVRGSMRQDRPSSPYEVYAAEHRDVCVQNLGWVVGFGEGFGYVMLRKILQCILFKPFPKFRDG